jgi:hypothetical protein
MPGGRRIAVAAIATWTIAVPQPGAVDVTASRTDGQHVVAAAGRLGLLRGLGPVTPFSGYTSGAGEPYIALSNHRHLRRAHCAFARNDVFALEPNNDAPTIQRIRANGTVQPGWAALQPGRFLSGIAFDTTGDFGYRLLVTAVVGNAVELVAIDCNGRAKVLGTTQPFYVEGGIAVAPRSFGAYGGWLFGANEQDGTVVAFDGAGHGQVIARSRLFAGPDIGVESAGFVPAHIRVPARTIALLADRGGQAPPHPGSDAFLEVPWHSLRAAGARPGDLLVAAEGGAGTIAVHCRDTCRVRRVARGPTIAHAEGHIEFARPSR